MTNKDVPELLLARGTLFAKHFSGLEHPLMSAVQRLLYVSDYASRQIPHLQSLLEYDDCIVALQQKDYRRLVAFIPLDISVTVFAQLLRYFRHRHLLRLLLRELAGFASTQETMTSWSYCADALVLHTLKYSEQQLSQRYGVSYTDEGQRAELYVVAMGKLGGNELNFSSDIDLIFAFSAAGHTNGEAPISNQQFFSKVVQQFIQLLQNITEDGFVFRVDLRLRPNGDSGPLVSTLTAMETYYQEQGRDWERYAMVKARPITASPSLDDWFKRLIPPFVYRRYVDFSVIESLRSMKTIIEREVQLNPLLDDIKRGPGGIREVEFIIQCFQLIRGGRIPTLQKQNAIAALQALKKEKLLAHTTVLQQAYLFLRKLENGLQAQNDQQTHSLPVDATKQAQIALTMGHISWDALLIKLHQYQRIIGHAFHAVLSKEHIYQDDKRVLHNQFASLWQGHIENKMAINLLASFHYNNPERCYQIIHDFRHSPRCRRLPQAARMRLDRFMTLLLSELIQVQKADDLLLQVLRLLENIVGRSAYLALLTENPVALQELLHWFAYSPFISSLLVNQPFLLEVLIDQERSWKPLSRKELAPLLKRRLSHAVDLESQDDMLRQFKLSCWLLAARAELYGQYNAVRIGQFLADVAEVIINEVLELACLQLSARYPDIMRIKSHFAVIAYGKLGAREMNYDSDVDLVFLHTVKPEDESLVTRLTQKMLHMLTTRTQTGILYAVDTRLRPSGSAGLLVSHFDAFMDYQSSHAWTWEHQSLLRTRVLFANQRERASFMKLKIDVLFLPRERKALGEDVQRMRAKIDMHVEGNAIKHEAGGLLDLEFLIQFLILAYPADNLVRNPNTLMQLKKLRENHVLSAAQFATLKRAYQHYHRALHQLLLQSDVIKNDAQQADVLDICREFY